MSLIQKNEICQPRQSSPLSTGITTPWHNSVMALSIFKPVKNQDKSGEPHSLQCTHLSLSHRLISKPSIKPATVTRIISPLQIYCRASRIAIPSNSSGCKTRLINIPADKCQAIWQRISRTSGLSPVSRITRYPLAGSSCVSLRRGVSGFTTSPSQLPVPTGRTNICCP